MFDPPLAQMQTEQRRLLWSSAIECAALMPSRTELSRWGLHGDALAQSVRDVLRAFWTSPTLRHAMAGAQLASEIDDTGRTVRPVATAYGISDLLGETGISRTWREGSIRLTKQPMRSAVLVALRAKDVLSALQQRRS